MQFALGVPLLLIAAYIVAGGTIVTARRQAHATTAWIVRAIGVPQFFADKIVAGGFALATLITHELGEHAIPIGRRVVGWIAGLAQYAALVGYWSLLWPKELFTFAYWLIHTYIPRALRGAVHPLSKIVHGTVKVIHTVETRIVHVAKAVPATAKTVVIQTVPRSVREASREIEWLRRHYKALTAAVAGAGAIALPWGGAGRIARDVLGLRKLYEKINRRTVGLGAVALVSAALVRMGLKWLQCGNVKRNLKTLCGFSPIRFADLLLDATAILSLISVVEFAHELEALEGEAVKILSLGIREFPAV